MPTVIEKKNNKQVNKQNLKNKSKEKTARRGVFLIRKADECEV